MAPKPATKRQARFPVLLSAIKSNAGKWLSADEWIVLTGVEDPLILKHSIHSFRAIAKRDGFPLEIKGSGDNKLYRWNESGAEEDKSGVDALILLKFGNRESMEFKLEHARQIYQQLHQLFGGAK